MSSILDTRDLDERKTELESLRDAVTEAETSLDEAGYPKGTPRDEIKPEDWHLIESLDSALESFGDDEKAELAELEELESEISEWRHGETLIPENDFEDYARQLAEDIGAISGDEQWPLSYIDWGRASNDLKMDYSEVTYQGETYLVRSC